MIGPRPLDEEASMRLLAAHEEGRSVITSSALLVLGAIAVGILVTSVGELLVGDASGGGVEGAKSVATDAAIAGVISLAAVFAARGSARAATILLAALTILALVAAWYTAMAFVFGVASYGVSRPLHGTMRRVGAIAGVLGVLGLLLFIVLVAKELLL